MKRVSEWLRALGLEQHEQRLAEQCIDWIVLPHLTDQDLERIGIPLGHRRKMLRAIADLEHGNAQARSTGVAERRQLTVMFCDLVGSTALSSRLDPEDMREILRGYQSACAKCVSVYDGFIARFVGDGILAYFGYPRAHEDDAERAVRAGLDIIAAVRQLETGPGVELRVRIGIATGLVVVGDLIGEGAAEQRAVVGETPNLAARLQALAQPDTLVVASSTRRLLGELFDVRHLGQYEIEGISEPVSAFLVEREKATDNRFAAVRAERLTALVGRDKEIAALVEEKQRAWRGQGRVVCISGDPGIGKSRIAAELNERIAAEPHITLRFQCSPYHANSALYPFIMWLERVAKINPDDTPQQRLDKLEAALLEVPDASASRSLLASMLSIPSMGRYPKLALSPAQQRRATFAALLAQLAGLARQSFVLFIFEDAHWADATSIELLGLMIERISNLPILAIITFRSEFKPPWPAAATSICLRRLHPPDIELMIRQITSGGMLPADVVDEIISKTDGIPLFVEEFTKAVLQAGNLVRHRDGFRLQAPLATPSIPATLHDSLMARLDRLGSVKEIAQIGAVIGREFSYALLSMVVAHDEAELRRGLAELENAELVFRSSRTTEADYTFKHALVRDAAYESLLRTRRQILHRRIAEVLCDRFAATAAAQAEVIARHFTQAGLTQMAIDWWEKAGQRSSEKSAYNEAISHFRTALGLVEERDDGPANCLLRLRLQTKYGQALLYGRGHGSPETTIAFIRARELAGRVEDAAERFSAYYGMWVGCLVRAELTAMQEIAQAFVGDAQRYPESPEVAIAHRVLGATAWFRGDYVDAQLNLEQALAGCGGEAVRQLPSGYGYDPCIMAMINLAPVLLPLGEVDRAAALIREAIRRALVTGHIPNLSISYYYSCLCEAISRNPDGVGPHAEALVGLADKHGLPQAMARGKFLLGWARCCSGDVSGEALMHQGLDLLREMNLRFCKPFNGTLLAQLQAQAGRIDEGLGTLDVSLATVENTGERWFHSEIYRMRGLLLQRRTPANLGESESALLRALEIARGQRTRTFELRAAISLASLYQSSGREHAARTTLEAALAKFPERGELPEFREADHVLAQLGDEPGRAGTTARAAPPGWGQTPREGR